MADRKPARPSPLRDQSSEFAHCSTERRHELLGQARFFSGLDEAELSRVNSVFREVHHPAGTWLHHEGDEATTLAIVAAGQVKLLQHGAAGQDVLLRIAGPGDLIGGFSAIGGSHPESAQAHTDVCLLNITASDFQELLLGNPRVALEVLSFSAEKLAEARSTIRGLSTEPVETRVARTLLQLAADHGEEGEAGTVIQMPLGQQDLAALAGTTVETVSRILSRFRRDGLTDSGRRWVVLRDRDALAELTGD